MIPSCTTDRICRTCGEPYGEYNPKSYAVANTCCMCVYSAKFQVQPYEEVKHPKGRWTDKKGEAA